MSLASTIRNGVATAKKLLDQGGLLRTVYILSTATPAERNPDGTPIRSKRTAYKALVTSALSRGSVIVRRSATGAEYVPTTKVVFLQPITIGVDDAVELPDGTVPEFQTIDRSVEPTTGGTFILTIYCG